MKILNADKIEIRIEKQKSNKNFTWCVYCRVEKSEETETVLMVKAKNRPFLLFQENKGDLVVNSKNVEKAYAKLIKTWMVDETTKTAFSPFHVVALKTMVFLRFPYDFDDFSFQNIPHT